MTEAVILKEIEHYYQVWDLRPKIIILPIDDYNLLSCGAQRFTGGHIIYPFSDGSRVCVTYGPGKRKALIF